MRYEPPVDRAGLIETVRERYGIPAQDLTFVPVGFAAACYVLTCTDEGHYFLKLWPNLRLGQEAAVCQYNTLVLTRALYDRNLYTRVPYPVPAHDGALWADLSGTPFAVFPLLPGESPPAQLPRALWSEFARTLATLHRATPHLIDVLPPRETFAIEFEPELLRGMNALAQMGPGVRPGLRALRDRLVSRHSEIRAQLARLHQLQEAVRRLGGPFVLCHTDLLGDNMLVDHQDQISVLDWDDATLAPPEHDLWGAVGDGLGAILDAYLEAGGARPLHLDHFAFYLLRRYLGDMAARVERLLHEDTTEHEDDDLLYGIEAYGFARWVMLDDTLATIAAALSRGP
jgi:spectinomycin phosphotransferase